MKSSLPSLVGAAVVDQAGDAGGLEDEDVADARRMEVVGDLVDEHLVAGLRDEVGQDGAGGVLLVMLAQAQVDGAVLEDAELHLDVLLADPDAVLLDLAGGVLQVDVGVLEPDGHGAGLELDDAAALPGDDAAVGAAADEEVEDLHGQAGRGDRDGRGLDAEERGLHRAGGDFERLEEEGADGERHDGGDDEDFHVLRASRPHGEGGKSLWPSLVASLLSFSRPSTSRALRSAG